MRIRLLPIILLSCTGMLSTESRAKMPFDPAEHAVFETTRQDGRYVSSRAIVHNLMDGRKPRLRYSSGMDSLQFAAWQDEVSRAMERLMRHPYMTDTDIKSPTLTARYSRDGYTVERWEAYPLSGAVVPYLVLVPDGVDADNPVPAILCIPGFGQTKELLCGESSIDLDSSVVDPGRNSMAYHYVKEGYIAVAVDNPGCGEPCDLENMAGSGRADYVTLSRALLELGWSYLGYTSYVDRHILEWMKTQPSMRADRLVVSGFSLGTEPLMALGAMDRDIYAFVYNDFLCTTRERALVMTMPDNNGMRPWPNDISHLIPEFLCEFDFPDIVASLAPRPLICTEGGLDRDFDLVRSAYSMAGEADAFTAYHYTKFADKADREPVDSMPAGIDRSTFFRLANVDPPNHYFKAEHVLPWLRALFKDDK